MKKKSVTTITALLICLGCVPSKASPVSPYCRFIQFCLFDREAAANDPAGIHKYSQDLIGLILPNPAGNDALRQFADQLAGRLASAEKAARADDGKLVPEEAVAKAFNNLMQGIGAPSSMRTDVVTIHRFRVHAASLKAFPALFSADGNGTNCYPGEAVFLLYYLTQYNGELPEGNLDTSLMEENESRNEGGTGSSAIKIQSVKSNANGLLFWYSSHQNPGATKTLLNHVVDTLGI